MIPQPRDIVEVFTGAIVNAFDFGVSAANARNQMQQAIDCLESRSSDNQGRLRVIANLPSYVSAVRELEQTAKSYGGLPKVQATVESVRGKLVQLQDSARAYERAMGSGSARPSGSR